MHFTTTSTFLSGLVVALNLATTVSAHGYMKYVDTAGVRYPAWQVGQDDYVTPTPQRWVRRVLDVGPAQDFTSKNITCGSAGNVPIPALIPVTAGAQVKFQWDQWGSSHAGPVMTYIAKCTPNCASFKGDSGAVWVKIDQMGFDNTASPKWASDKLATLGASWTVTIPPALADGEYLLRHEILGLHVAGTLMGAQFYPSCAQIKVSGGGSQVPSGGIALPGAYIPTDPGILAELWKFGTLTNDYTPPGGPVWAHAGAQLNGVGTVGTPSVTATYSGTAAPAVTTSTTSAAGAATSASSTKSTSTTTTTTAAAATSAVAGSVGAYGQCGGIGYTGAKTCVSGYTCKVLNEYYSQCVA